MCLPRMDSPSVFGAILDRDAGGFRVGPAGRDRSRRAGATYPGTMVLETSWENPHGVGDRARRAEHRPVAPPERALAQPPALADRPRRRSCAAADWSSACRARPRSSSSASRRSTTAAWRPTGPIRARVTARRWPRSEGMDLELQARHRSAPRLRGPARAGTHDAARRGASRSSALGWSEHALPTRLRGGGGVLARAHRSLLAGVAQAGHVPRPPLARAICSAAR